MKRALALLSLSLLAACASNDGFVDNKSQQCGPESRIGIEAGWDRGSLAERGDTRLTMLVRVSNNADEDIVVKAVRVDPLSIDRESMLEIDRGSVTPDETIPEGEESTFEVPMNARWQTVNRGGGVRASGLDVIVNVELASEQTVRCRFRVPL